MKQLTRQEAINQNCKDCNYDQLSGGTWRQQISLCPTTNCPFYSYRPLDDAHSALRRKENISKLTPKQLEAYKRNSERLKSLKTSKKGVLVND